MLLKWLCIPLVLAPAFAQQTVRFHVVKGDQPVTNLTKDDFVLLEDGVPRSITQFSQPPVELIFLLDGTIPFDPNDPRGPDSPVLNIPALSNMIADPRVNIHATIYAYGSGLKRFCAPTRDPETLANGFAGVSRIPFFQRHEGATKSLPLIDASNPPREPERSIMRDYVQPIPAPGERVHVSGIRQGREMLSWNEALIATARDVAREPSTATRIVIPLLNGLPEPGWDPQEVARVYQDLGFILYPRISLRQWILGERWALTHNKPERHGTPKASGLDWKRMSKAEKLAWLGQEDALAKSYEALGEQTGGRASLFGDHYGTIASLLEAEVPSIYVAQVDISGAHKIEIRLRDESQGKVVGGTRMTGL